MKRVVPFILFLFVLNIYSQDKLESFPDDLNFKPFMANIFEPRLGFVFQTGENQLRMDIGSSLDILRYQTEDDIIFGFGADMFTYTFLRGEDNFHFPVDAVDYLFGLNFTAKKKLGCGELGARLRISHISAHFVDGHYSGSTGEWLDGRGPIVYSREFLEFMPYYKINDFRFYAGTAYIFHVDPEDLGKDYYELGAEYIKDGLLFGVASPYAAYDLRITNLDEYKANHSFALGVKFGKPGGKGFSLYYNYYDGYSIHGEYFNVEDSYSAIGINLDL